MQPWESKSFKKVALSKLETRTKPERNIVLHTDSMILYILYDQTCTFSSNISHISYSNFLRKCTDFICGCRHYDIFIIRLLSYIFTSLPWHCKNIHFKTSLRSSKSAILAKVSGLPVSNADNNPAYGVPLHNLTFAICPDVGCYQKPRSPLFGTAWNFYFTLEYRKRAWGDTKSCSYKYGGGKEGRMASAGGGWTKSPF